MIANNHGHLVSIASSAGLIGVNGLAGLKLFVCPTVSIKLCTLTIQFVGDTGVTVCSLFTFQHHPQHYNS